MRALFAAAILIAQIAVAQPALAGGYVNGNLLYQYCNSSEGTATYYQHQTFCSAYIAGVADTFERLRSLTQSERGHSASICIPANVTVGQMKDIVFRYLSANPQHRHYAASDLVVIAIVDAFPDCRLKPR